MHDDCGFASQQTTNVAAKKKPEHAALAMVASTRSGLLDLV
jgi:hypothetical protein